MTLTVSRVASNETYFELAGASSIADNADFPLAHVHGGAFSYLLSGAEHRMVCEAGATYLIEFTVNPSTSGTSITFKKNGVTDEKVWTLTGGSSTGSLNTVLHKFTAAAADQYRLINTTGGTTILGLVAIKITRL